MARIEKPTDNNTAAESLAYGAAKTADQLQTLAEKGAEQSKEAYTKVKEGAEEAQKLVEDSFSTAVEAASELSLKAIAAARASFELGFSHLEALAGARSPSEIIELQTTFVRKGSELAVGQVREFQSATVNAVQSATLPLKSVFDKTLKEYKLV